MKERLAICLTMGALFCSLPACMDGAITGADEGTPRTLPDAGDKPDPSDQPGPSAEGVVFFPNGACETGVLEVHIDGAAHPTQPRLNAGDCLRVDKTAAMSSLQVRCVDPTGARPPSAWVGPAVADGAEDLSACAQVFE